MHLGPFLPNGTQFPCLKTRNGEKKTVLFSASCNRDVVAKKYLSLGTSDFAGGSCLIWSVGKATANV